MSRFNDPPRMGATFSPGIDDYYLPASPLDVVSPAPQRITPEMPGQIQDSLTNLELNGGRMDSRSPAPPSGRTSTPRAVSGNQAPYQNQVQNRTFSPLPKLSNRTPNVPQSYEEREATLENARSHVLQSSDPEMQLNWSQDVLSHVEICADYERRNSASQNARPMTPQVERQMKTDAVSIVSFLAGQQHPRADFIKGMWLEFGKFGFPQDKPEAFRSYKRAAAKGYARAEYRMGLQYESTGESIKALQHYKSGESLGDSAACYRMGMMSLTGQLGQAQDFETAIRLIRQAADCADENAAHGAYVLGMLQGRELPDIKVPETILPVDLASARMNVEKAAFLGFAKAQVKMGTAYEMCLFGCEFNPILSLHYNALAARQGESEAEMALSKWFLCGHEGSFPKNEELAFKYAQRAASSGGLPTAQFAMGYFYEIGLTVQSNISTAVDWYKQASQNGNKDAQGRLDAISKSSTLSRKDHENVAVTRIKSQYGSRRGKYPSKVVAMPSPPMQTITDEKARFGRPQQHVPPSGRVTPYPDHDRPSTTSPYLAGDKFASQRPRPAPGGYPAVDQRPYSSTGDGRYDQTSSSYPGAQSPIPQGRPGQIPSPRPNTVAGNVNAGPPGPQVSGPGFRQPIQGMDQGRLTPQTYRPQSGQPNPRPYPERPHSSASGPPYSGMADIGFSAPVDSRADQRNRPPAPPTSHQRLDTRPPWMAQRQPSPGGGRNNRPTPTSNSHGAGSQSNYTMSGGLPTQTQKPPAATSGASSSKPASSRPTESKPVAPQKPPGPQTFEEMGVPQDKKDHDCAVM